MPGHCFGEPERGRAGGEATFQDGCRRTFGLRTFLHVGNQRSVQARPCSPSACRHRVSKPAFEALVLQARRPSSLGVS